jgi:hypothetical protein
MVLQTRLGGAAKSWNVSSTWVRYAQLRELRPEIRCASIRSLHFDRASLPRIDRFSASQSKSNEPVTANRIDNGVAQRT